MNIAPPLTGPLASLSPAQPCDLRSWFWLFAAVCCGWSALVGCAPAGGRPAETQEIELDEPLPADPAPPRVQPCHVDDATGCVPQKRSEQELDPEQRYSVPVGADDPMLGPDDAKVTLVVFSDFQCPYCSRMNATLEELRDEFPDQVRIIWKDLPLPMHEFAASAALLGRAAYAAGGHAHFWQAHALIFERQASLSDQTLKEIAKQLNVPWPAPRQLGLHIDRDVELANALNVEATPTSFINGRPVFGAQPFDVYEALVEEELE